MFRQPLQTYYEKASGNAGGFYEGEYEKFFIIVSRELYEGGCICSLSMVLM